jgi:DNA-directed RNA polymerase specialized sigma subunit
MVVSNYKEVMLIRNEKEYREALSRLKQDEEVIDAQRRALVEMGLPEEQVERGLGPMLSASSQIREEINWYERALRRDFEVSHDVGDIGRMLVALRIANDLTQADLANKLGVSEAQVSRDERNEYHGITVERAQRILEAMGETMLLEIEERAMVHVER